MKHFILTLLFITLTVQGFSQSSNSTVTTISHIEKNEPNWETNFEKAQKLAKKKNRPLLVFFTGSDWCGPCKQLHKYFFNTEEFVSLSSKKIILYKADFPRRTDLVSPEQKEINNKIKRQFGVRGFPTVIILDSNGKEIGRKTGFSFDHDTTAHYNLVNKAIKSK